MFNKLAIWKTNLIEWVKEIRSRFKIGSVLYVNLAMGFTALAPAVGYFSITHMLNTNVYETVVELKTFMEPNSNNQAYLKLYTRTGFEKTLFGSYISKETYDTLKIGTTTKKDRDWFLGIFPASFLLICGALYIKSGIKYEKIDPQITQGP